MSEPIKVTCSKCKVEFTVDTDLVKDKVKTKQYLYCPNGHPGNPEIGGGPKKSQAKKPARSKK